MVRRDLGEIVSINNKNVVVAKYERLFNTTIDIFNDINNRYLASMGRKLSESEKKNFTFQIEKFINGNLRTLKMNSILLDDEGKQKLKDIMSSILTIRNKVDNSSNFKSLFKSKKNLYKNAKNEINQSDFDLS